MADMVTVERLRELKRKHPDAKVVSYVNTNADLKAESYICCTSSNAQHVVDSVLSHSVIFVPDENLSHFVSRTSKKKIIPWRGFCHVHQRIQADEIRRVKRLYPDALLLVHPECVPEVVETADEVLSTGGMVRYARESDATKFIVATEEGLLHRLRRENPGKEFVSAGMPRICSSMKRITLRDVYQALRTEQFEVKVDEHILERARFALRRMMQVSRPAQLRGTALQETISRGATPSSAGNGRA